MLIILITKLMLLAARYRFTWMYLIVNAQKMLLIVSLKICWQVYGNYLNAF